MGISDILLELSKNYLPPLRHNTIQYNSLLTLPWWGFSVTMENK